MLTVIILTRDEERHIARAIASVRRIAEHILVVDSGSTDQTVPIAEHLGARVLYNPWINYARQFNWALERLPTTTTWLMRLDADEIVTPELAREIAVRLPEMPQDVHGLNVARRMTFLGREIRYGGLFPVRVLRIFRYGAGRCEDRWMDEHIKVSGRVVDLEGEILDDNQNSLTWWTAKHNSYSSREVVDLLNLELGFMAHDSIASPAGTEAEVKRWLKEAIYARLPSGQRAILYFIWRSFVRLGFLDGPKGMAFHALQGLWYRYLVDAKLAETKAYMEQHGVKAPEAIREVLGLDVTK